MLLAGSLVACNSDALPPGGQYGAVTGTILDHVTNAPIAGAHITVDAILVAVTDQDGTFTVANVPSGDFDYTITADGYAPYDGSAKTEPNKPFVLNLTLEKKPASV